MSDLCETNWNKGKILDWLQWCRKPVLEKAVNDRLAHVMPLKKTITDKDGKSREVQSGLSMPNGTLKDGTPVDWSRVVKFRRGNIKTPTNSPNEIYYDDLYWMDYNPLAFYKEIWDSNIEELGNIIIRYNHELKMLKKTLALIVKKKQKSLSRAERKLMELETNFPIVKPGLDAEEEENWKKLINSARGKVYKIKNYLKSNKNMLATIIDLAHPDKPAMEASLPERIKEYEKAIEMYSGRETASIFTRDHFKADVLKNILTHAK